MELPSLQAAGGLLLLLVALELLTGKSADPAELESAQANVAFVPLGTPLLTGPGAIVILRVLKGSGVELLTRIAGLLLSAIAVQLIVDAVRTLIANGLR